MRDNCTEAEAQQVRMWLRERLKDPGLDQLFSDLLDATETEYDPEGKERACGVAGLDPRGMPARIPPAAVTSGGGGGPPYNRIRRRRCRRRSGAPLQASGQHPARVGGGLCRHGRAREIVLPDSTHVWLNAGTKLIYPKQFNRSMRQVYLSGEMFADVPPRRGPPFIVSADRLEVKVLGTQFNLKSIRRTPSRR